MYPRRRLVDCPDQGLGRGVFCYAGANDRANIAEELPNVYLRFKQAGVSCRNPYLCRHRPWALAIAPRSTARGRMNGHGASQEWLATAGFLKKNRSHRCAAGPGETLFTESNSREIYEDLPADFCVRVKRRPLPSWPQPATASGRAAVCSPRRRRRAIPTPAGYVDAKELPDGAVSTGRRRWKLHPRPDASSCGGDVRCRKAWPQGKVLQLHHELGRQQDLSRHRAGRFWGRSILPTRSRIVVTTKPSRAHITRRVAVYVPSQYVPRHGPRHSSSAARRDRTRACFTAMNKPDRPKENPRDDRRLDRQRIRRRPRAASAGLEYDTMFRLVCRVLSRSESAAAGWKKTANVKLTKTPDGRGDDGAPVPGGSGPR